ncbi:SUN domain-containing protein 3-like [Venturia canescens]|uniref:SUN domain-containing protein 3-like n=1 Tax=Venturia canescens TaxID=32260 RepID=UPI001C9C53B7|nr:SUN domain-containing protein 3-like [Venturia canescens]
MAVLDLRSVILALMSFDLWILVNVRRSTKKIGQFLNVMFEITVLIIFVVGILSIYALPQLRLRLTTYDDDASIRGGMKSPNVIGITDASKIHEASKVEQELKHLKTKALSLEMAFRRMNSQLRAIHIRDQFKDEELADFASEAAGGSVLETPNTESFYESKMYLSLFGIPLCKPNHLTPRKVIQPWSEAGECWAFRGDRGNIKIELAHAAFIEQVALEHIPVTASLTGKIDSAPREFRVTALIPGESISTQTFMYNQYGSSSQIFHITDEKFTERPIKIVILEILSNWGNSNYTCVYRFKVHGRISL